MNVKEVMTRQMITDRFLALLEKARPSLSPTRWPPPKARACGPKRQRSPQRYGLPDFRGQYPGNSALYKGDGRHRRLLGIRCPKIHRIKYADAFLKQSVRPESKRKKPCSARQEALIPIKAFIFPWDLQRLRQAFCFALYCLTTHPSFPVKTLPGERR